MIHPAEAVTGFCWSENRVPISHVCSTTYYHRYTMVLPNFQTDHWDHISDISQHSSIVAGFRWNPETSRGPRPPTAGLTWPIISRAQLAATETKAKDRKRAIASSTNHIRPTAVAVKASTNMQHTRHTIDQKWASAFQLDFCQSQLQTMSDVWQYGAIWGALHRVQSRSPRFWSSTRTQELQSPLRPLSRHLPGSKKKSNQKQRWPEKNV